MTCIVGIEHEGKVYIGGDRAQANESHTAAMSGPKVFVKNNIAFGYTTSFRFGNLLQYSFVIPHRYEGQELMDYMYTVFVEALRKCFKEGGYTKVENSVEEGGTALIGIGGKVFKLQDNFSLTNTASGYEAVGSGMYYALGSLHTTSLHTIGWRALDNPHTSNPVYHDPKLRCELALQAAADLNPFVRAPFDVVSV
jgi:hypothetical protein